MKRSFIGTVAALAALGVSGWLASSAAQRGAEGRDNPAEGSAPSKQGPAETVGAEAGIKAITADYVAAFNAADAKAAAALWTAEGEYVGADEVAIRGRAEIEKSLDGYLKANPKATVSIRIDSVRPLGRGLANAEGVVALKMPGDDPVIESRYTALHVLEDGKWRAATIREWVPDPATDVTIKNMEWIIGTWSSKGDGGEVETVYAWDAAKVFITGTYKVTKDGKTISSGTQMIARNPSGGLRSWMFDSSGTTADGLWVRDDGRWVNEANGVLPDGTEITSVNVIIPLGPDAFTWHTVEREIDGIPVPALPPIKVTRVKK